MANPNAEVGDRARSGVVTEVYRVGGMPWAGLPSHWIAVVRRDDGGEDRYFADDITGRAFTGHDGERTNAR